MVNLDVVAEFNAIQQNVTKATQTMDYAESLIVLFLSWQTMKESTYIYDTPSMVRSSKFAQNYTDEWDKGANFTL